MIIHDRRTSTVLRLAHWEFNSIDHKVIASHLFEQEVSVVRRTGDKVLGQLEEGLEQLQGQVFSRRLAEEVRDDEESAAGNDLLLNAGRALHQLAYEAHQLRTESERDR